MSEIQKFRKSEKERGDNLANVHVVLDEEGFVAFEADCRRSNQTVGQRLTSLIRRALGHQK